MGIWYANEKMVDAVNLCMDAIKKSGISAKEAQQLPQYLDKAIRCSNEIFLQNSGFTPASITVEARNGGYDVTPWGVSTV